MQASLRKRRWQGFTLVEMLVALTISSIIILAVNAALSQGMRLWRRVEEPRSHEEQGREIIRLMRTELAGLYMPPKKGNEEPPLTYFHSSQTGEFKCSFFTTTPSYECGLRPGRCARVTYEYRCTQDSGVLIRRECLAAGQKIISESTADVLADGVSSFSFRLLTGEGKAYQLSQEGEPKPPGMVAMNVGWTGRHVMTGQRQPTVLAAMFPVPVEGGLLPKSQGE